MKNKNVLDNMTNVYPTLTKSSKKIADYIFAHKTEAQYMSITSLSEECGVADATISRFCKSLGYDGYNSFKLALAKVESTQLADSHISVYDKITNEDSIVSMAKKLYALDIAAMQQSLDLIKEEDMAKAVQYLCHAGKIYSFGQGGSSVIAREAWARFITVTPQFHCIDDNHMQALAASMMQPTDVILFFSYSGSTKDGLDTLTLARNRGAKIILVTHFPKCPISSLADVILLCGSRESPLHSGSIAAKLGQLFIIDILYNEYCRQNTAYVEANLDATSIALATKLV